METVSLEIVKNYILSEGGMVTSQQIVRKFQPFLKDPNNKARNKELFKSYLSTLTDYRHEEGSNVKILELKKEYKTDDYFKTPPIIASAQHHADKQDKHVLFLDPNQQPPRRNTVEPPSSAQPLSPAEIRLSPTARRNNAQSRRNSAEARRNSLDPRRSPTEVRRGSADTRRSSAEMRRGSMDSRRGSEETQRSPDRRYRGNVAGDSTGVNNNENVHNGAKPAVKATKPMIRTASINAINMFNNNAKNASSKASVKPVENRIPENVDEEVLSDNAETLEYGTGDEFPEELESGCSTYTLEQSEKEWIIKSAVGDCDTISRLLLQDKNLVYYKDFISGYTGLHWSCKLGNLPMANVLLEAGSESNTRSYSGHTPLHLAAQTGNMEMVCLLTRYGADKEIRDYSGKKPFQYIPDNASDNVKMVLAIPQPQHFPNSKLMQPLTQRKYSRALTLAGLEFKDDSTPRRHPTLNQAWKKLKAPSGFKTTFASKKAHKIKENHKIDSNKNEGTPRNDAKENRKDRSQTLPTGVNKQSSLYF